MASTGPNFAEYGVETTSVNTAPGVNLSEQQKLLTGSVLDLFAGRPSKRKLGLWTDNATFSDPLTIAEGRKQYEAQCSEVTSAGNPTELALKTKYKIKGLGSEQTIDSNVKIFTTQDGKIERVEDRWNDNLPDSAFAKAMRNLNSVVVPTMVSVPKSVEEEESNK